MFFQETTTDLVKDDEDEAGDCDNDNKCIDVDYEVCKPVWYENLSGVVSCPENI